MNPNMKKATRIRPGQFIAEVRKIYPRFGRALLRYHTLKGHIVPVDYMPYGTKLMALYDVNDLGDFLKYLAIAQKYRAHS